MKTAIKVPSIGESITEVTLSSQFKPNGTFVNEGEEIGELETDKVNQVIYAPKSGILNWSVNVGQTISISQDLGIIDEEGSAPKTQQPILKEETKITPAKEITVQPAKESKPVTEAKMAESKAQETAFRKPMSTLRQTLSKKLVDAKNLTAMLTTFNEVDMTSVMKVREKYKDEFMKSHGVKLGFMAFFIKASSLALKAFPEVSYQIEGTDFIKPQSIDIGVAVSTEKGLMVPIISNCDKKSFAEIEKGLAELAEKARNKTLQLQDLKGGCFSITNGGVFGSLISTPILNMPQSAILGMHSIQKRPIAKDDQVVIAPMMYLALSYDHRVIDGKEAVQFLVMIKKILEEHAEDLYLDREF
jgi:2-oxoglutarate dehydrogenase E2 component (dihydrolipoamide succinyltransferase)